MPTDTTPDVAASLLDLAERVSQLEAGLRQLREPTPDTSGVDLNDIASIWYGEQRFAVGTVVLFHPGIGRGWCEATVESIEPDGTLVLNEHGVTWRRGRGQVAVKP